ncbi:MAG: mitochondrial fission ELM1 family protein [Alphaproteobacteria bacterium]|nr:mitochondrial fission ELM1 family protein [Alphaproteobacteria bacterium]MBU6474097.1 mitochondrial fission ELM1 family protein [Alphaproteobacteria bacterium]MDE2011756.1 mitochondrial fission ELM1 family protein [Alphaproteobacteria bacterium]MDE2072948.1 mitochondrial fission ELM1 family protein [Alphaproteobacteria bacterium]MDE2351848.1 mitochondrial fission ELM1 family protein [Alphaproteobacteria bacterium]
MDQFQTAPACWVVTDGKAGMQSQCVGLAEALGYDPVIKQVALRAPWRQLSPYFRMGHDYAFTKGSDPLLPPWPDLLIATGRHSIAASLYVREQSRRAGKRTVTVQIQNPVLSPRYFDLVIVPQHDRLSGPNVISTMGALHRITPELLKREAEIFAPQVAHLPRPYIGVLIGGPNSAYSFGEEEMTRLARLLVRAADDGGGSLLVTPSRRTGERNMAILREILGARPAFIWDGTGANPYFGMLGLADYLVVTSDSVNMVSEAVAAAKPVHVFDLPGGTAKFGRFHAALRTRGLAHPFDGSLHSDVPDLPNDDMARAVQAVRAAMCAAWG